MLCRAWNKVNLNYGDRFVPVIDEIPGFNVNAFIYATDFSLGSQNAGLYAQMLARYFSCRLAVAHAFTLSQAALEVEVDRRLVSQQRKDLQLLLAQKADQLKDGPLEVVPSLLDGDPKNKIPALADQMAPSILVLGTHGGGWVERDLVGSTAEQILRSTRWPSLTVGPQVAPPSRESFPFRKILYATDLTPAAAHAAAYAVSFAQTFGAEINVLNVVHQGAIDHPDRLTEIKQKFYSALDHTIPRYASDFCAPRTFVEVGNAREQILRHLREHAVHLLVLGIRKSSHLGLEMRTSGAFELIVHAPCPVLTIVG